MPNPRAIAAKSGPRLETGGHVALSVEKLLLLADKPEMAVVQHADADVEAVLRDSRKLLDVHEKRAVPCERIDGRARVGERRSHGGGNGEAHGSQARRR